MDPQRNKARSRGPRASPASFSGLWRLFSGLAILQVVDLITTYEFLVDGGREGNIFIRELILTPAVPVLKAFALVFLAILVIRSIDHGRPTPGRLRAAMWFITVVYLLVIANNLAILLS